MLRGSGAGRRWVRRSRRAVGVEPDAAARAASARAARADSKELGRISARSGRSPASARAKRAAARPVARIVDQRRRPRPCPRSTEAQRPTTVMRALGLRRRGAPPARAAPSRCRRASSARGRRGRRALTDGLTARAGARPPPRSARTHASLTVVERHLHRRAPRAAGRASASSRSRTAVLLRGDQALPRPPVAARRRRARARSASLVPVVVGELDEAGHQHARAGSVSANAAR